MKYMLIGIVYLYKISPLGSHSLCNFTPTCSTYMIESLNKYGTIKGSILGIKRILRCHPFGKVGYDPIPNDDEKENL